MTSVSAIERFTAWAIRAGKNLYIFTYKYTHSLANSTDDWRTSWDGMERSICFCGRQQFVQIQYCAVSLFHHVIQDPIVSYRILARTASTFSTSKICFKWILIPVNELLCCKNIINELMSGRFLCLLLGVSFFPSKSFCVVIQYFMQLLATGSGNYQLFFPLF